MIQNVKFQTKVNEYLPHCLFDRKHIDPALRGQRMPQGTPIYDAVTLDFAVVLKIGKKKEKKSTVWR